MNEEFDLFLLGWMPDYKGRVVPIYNWGALLRVFTEHDMSVFLHGGSGIENWPTQSFWRPNQPILYDPKEEEPYYVFDGDFAAARAWIPKVICPTAICSCHIYKRFVIVQHPWALIEDWYIIQQHRLPMNTKPAKDAKDAKDATNSDDTGEATE